MENLVRPSPLHQAFSSFSSFFTLPSSAVASRSSNDTGTLKPCAKCKKVFVRWPATLLIVLYHSSSLSILAPWRSVAHGFAGIVEWGTHCSACRGFKYLHHELSQETSDNTYMYFHLPGPLGILHLAIDLSSLLGFLAIVITPCELVDMYIPRGQGQGTYR